MIARLSLILFYEEFWSFTLEILEIMRMRINRFSDDEFETILSEQQLGWPWLGVRCCCFSHPSCLCPPSRSRPSYAAR